MSRDADDRIARPAVDRSDLADAEAFLCSRLAENVRTFGDQVPAPASEDRRYPLTDPVGWTTGFWVGQLWLAYELTGEHRYRAVAERRLDDLAARLEAGAIETHDLGFLFSISAVAARQLTGSERALSVAIGAADALLGHVRHALGIVEPATAAATNEETLWDPGEFIVDTLVNLPLLYWATTTTGDDRYAAAARSHTDRTTEHLVRDDGSTFQTCRLDPETGNPVRIGTFQGHADDSCWARGQAWAIYGYGLGYRYTGAESLRDVGTRVADYYLAATPTDGVPAWNLAFDPGDDEPRDSSAAAIAACGFDELARALPVAAPAKQRYENAALRILDTLQADSLTAGLDSNGILAHGVYNLPADKGVDE